MVFAGISGCLAVILGAFGAHYLKKKVGNGMFLPEDFDAYKTGVQYQFIHTLAIVGVFAIKDKIPLYNKTITTMFALGIIFFSGSLYLLSTGALTGCNFKWLGPVTPLGGLCFIGGWVCLALSVVKQKSA